MRLEGRARVTVAVVVAVVAAAVWIAVFVVMSPPTQFDPISP